MAVIDTREASEAAAGEFLATLLRGWQHVHRPWSCNREAIRCPASFAKRGCLLIALWTPEAESCCPLSEPPINHGPKNQRHDGVSYEGRKITNVLIDADKLSRLLVPEFGIADVAFNWVQYGAEPQVKPESSVQ